MRIGLLGKSKLGFVDGRYPKSKFEPEFHKKWEKVNVIVLSWIMNVVRPGLLSSVVYASIAHKVWEDLKERFDKYEFDTLMPCPGCPCPESKKYAEHFEYHRLLQFLKGLKDTYSQARSQIMMMSPVPSINKAYSLLMDVESQRNLANFSQMMQVVEVADSTALYSNKNPTTGYGQFRAQKKTVFRDLQGRGEGITCGLQQMQVPSSTGFQHMSQQMQMPSPIGFQHMPQQQAPTPTTFFSQEQYQEIDQLLNKGADEVPSARAATAVPSQKGSKVHLPTGNVASISHIGKASDLYSGQMKEIGKEDQGLYLMQGKSLLSGRLQYNPAQLRNKTPQQVSEVKFVNKTTKSGNKFACMANECSDSSVIWHRRIGHAPLDVIKKYTSLSNLKNTNHTHFSVCPLAKQTKLSYKLSSTTSNATFELLHCDVWGPYRVTTYDSKRFFVTIVDDYSRFTWIFLLVSKSDTVVVLKDFLTKVKNVFSVSVKTLRTDNGSEFFNHEVHNLLSSMEIIHQSTCTYTPQQHGVAERIHRTILEMAKAMKFQAAIPLKF
uniref:Integrase catalytic domain-containing protein n=1 Tax=Nicotiana tabacum TaxID=4097 RepID=A0A1S3XVF8_TOBAC|nr:PREDICTED: uncharacterized protein LOC107769240 [Nicotiana tabacum]